jgi:delta 1-pyrroline-5-carboxylate dehydrogenase
MRMANDIAYGLSSYVWTENLGRAHRVAAAIEAGMCFVNSQNVRDLRQPFGGTKASGTGREGGTWSYEVFWSRRTWPCRWVASHSAPHPALGRSAPSADLCRGAFRTVFKGPVGQAQGLGVSAARE